MMGFGGIFGILIIVILVWAVIQFTGKNSSNNPFSSNQPHSQSGEETSLEILKKRYARGEVTKEEFDKMKRDLS